METKLTPKGTRIVSNLVISFFAVVSLAAFLFSIDRTLVVIILSVIMLLASLFLMWRDGEFDSISLLIFFFGTTACFFFFSDIVTQSWIKAVSVLTFALLSFVLSNYLLNTVTSSPLQKSVYKIALAIIFTEIFWVLSFLETSQISKGAITAVLFFNFEVFIRDYLAEQFQRGKFAFLSVASIILLAIVIYRI